MPLYGLEPFAGKRRLEGRGRDLCTIVHCDDVREWQVGTVRRTTIVPQGGGARVAVSADRVRKTVARALAADLPGVGDVFALAQGLASDPSAWRTVRVSVDGEERRGYEIEHEGMWIAYTASADLIIYVLAPIQNRLSGVTLRVLGDGEVA